MAFKNTIWKLVNSLKSTLSTRVCRLLSQQGSKKSLLSCVTQFALIWHCATLGYSQLNSQSHGLVCNVLLTSDSFAASLQRWVTHLVFHFKWAIIHVLISTNPIHMVNTGKIHLIIINWGTKLHHLFTFLFTEKQKLDKIMFTKSYINAYVI